MKYTEMKMGLKVVLLLYFGTSFVVTIGQLSLEGDAVKDKPLILECRMSNSINLVTFTDGQGNSAGSCSVHSNCSSGKGYNMTMDLDRHIFYLTIPNCNSSIEGRWQCTRTSSKGIDIRCIQPPASVAIVSQNNSVTCTSGCSNRAVYFLVEVWLQDGKKPINSFDVKGTKVSGSCMSSSGLEQSYTASVVIPQLPGKTVTVNCYARAHGIKEDKNIPCNETEIVFPLQPNRLALLGLIVLIPDTVFTAAFYFKPYKVFKDVEVTTTMCPITSCLFIGLVIVIVSAIVPLEQAAALGLGCTAGLVFGGTSFLLKLWCCWHSKKPENKETTDQDVSKEYIGDPETNPSREENEFLLSNGVKIEDQRKPQEDLRCPSLIKVED